MSKKKYKLVKNIGAFALAGIMVTSFVGCSVKNSVSEEQSEPISLYDENGNILSVIAFIDENNNNSRGEESYGYIQKNGEKYEFYDVLYDNTYSLYEGQLSNYSIYYAPFSELLLENDFNKAIAYGSVDKSTIYGMEKKVNVDIRTNNCYFVGSLLVSNSANLEKFDPEKNFVDKEESKEQESTTLTKNK